MAEEELVNIRHDIGRHEDDLDRQAKEINDLRKRLESQEKELADMRVQLRDALQTSLNNAQKALEELRNELRTDIKALSQIALYLPNITLTKPLPSEHHEKFRSAAMRINGRYGTSFRV
jgi:chromosome segregation ATPase